MTAPDGKRQRYHRLADASSVTGQNMSSLLATLKELQADSVARRQLLAAYHARFAEVARVERLACTGVTFFDWESADPFALLRRALDESPAFQHMFIDALREHPSSLARPWHIISVFDRIHARQ